MKKPLTLLSALALTACASRAPYRLTPKSVEAIRSSTSIQDVCIARQPGAVRTDRAALTSALEDLQTRYATPQNRHADLAGYSKALDRVVEHSEFSGLLQCVADWRRRGADHVFATAETEGPMALSTSPARDDQGRSLQVMLLTVSTHSAPQRTLIAYMHELVHACFTPERLRNYEMWDQTWNALTPDEKDIASIKMERFAKSGLTSESVARLDAFESANAAIWRLAAFEEVVAHTAMMDFYQNLLRFSPRLCTEENPPATDPSLNEVYAAGIDSLKRGHAAQWAAMGYQEAWKEGERWIYDGRPATDYAVPFSKSVTKLSPFSPVLAERIRAVGIPLNEP